MGLGSLTLTPLDSDNDAHYGFEKVDQKVF